MKKEKKYIVRLSKEPESYIQSIKRNWETDLLVDAEGYESKKEAHSALTNFRVLSPFPDVVILVRESSWVEVPQSKSKSNLACGLRIFKRLGIYKKTITPNKIIIITDEIRSINDRDCLKLKRLGWGHVWNAKDIRDNGAWVYNIPKDKSIPVKLVSEPESTTEPKPCSKCGSEPEIEDNGPTEVYFESHEFECEFINEFIAYCPNCGGWDVLTAQSANEAIEAWNKVMEVAQLEKDATHKVSIPGLKEHEAGINLLGDRNIHGYKDSILRTQFGGRIAKVKRDALKLGWVYLGCDDDGHKWRFDWSRFQDTSEPVNNDYQSGIKRLGSLFVNAYNLGNRKAIHTHHLCGYMKGVIEGYGFIEINSWDAKHMAWVFQPKDTNAPHLENKLYDNLLKGIAILSNCRGRVEFTFPNYVSLECEDAFPFSDYGDEAERDIKELVRLGWKPGGNECDTVCDMRAECESNCLLNWYYMPDDTKFPDADEYSYEAEKWKSKEEEVYH